MPAITPTGGSYGHGETLSDKVLAKSKDAFIAGMGFWPVANVFNFAFISPAHRVPYLAACGGVWNSFLSWLNARGGLWKKGEVGEGKCQ